MNFIDTTYVKQFVDWKTRSDRQTMAETLCEQLEENLLPSLENNSIQMLVFSTWYFAKTYKNMPLSDAKKVISKMYGNTPLITHAITENAKDFIANDQPEWFTNEVNTFLKNR